MKLDGAPAAPSSAPGTTPAAVATLLKPCVALSTGGGLEERGASQFLRCPRCLGRRLGAGLNAGPCRLTEPVRGSLDVLKRDTEPGRAVGALRSLVGLRHSQEHVARA